MARKTKANERLGETFINAQGSMFYIKHYHRNNDVIVKFLDEYGVEVHTTYQNCQNGKVKNPYDKTVYGVAYLGETDVITFADGKPTREYSLWKEMIARCYSGRYPTYADVTVCERWLCFANFLEDLPLIEEYELWLNNPNQRICLDKDVKQRGIVNKVYSVETCKFITDSENTGEMLERRYGKGSN